MAHVTGQKREKNMNTELKTLNKSVKLADGSKIKKSGTITMPVFASLTEVSEFLGENLSVFAWVGFRAFCKIHANNVMAGGGEKDKDLKAALRNFRATIEVMVEELGIPQETAVETMLAKTKFAGVKTYLSELADSGKVHNFDFSSEYPIPEFGTEKAPEVAEDEDDDDAK